MKKFLVPLSVYKYAMHENWRLAIETNNSLYIYRKKIELSISSESFDPYIDVLKLLLSASAFDISSSFRVASFLFYKFAQYTKPYENATKFTEAADLHDELYEIVSKIKVEYSDEAEVDLDESDPDEADSDELSLDSLYVPETEILNK